MRALSPLSLADTAKPVAECFAADPAGGMASNLPLADNRRPIGDLQPMPRCRGWLGQHGSRRPVSWQVLHRSAMCEQVSPDNVSKNADPINQQRCPVR